MVGEQPWVALVCLKLCKSGLATSKCRVTIMVSRAWSHLSLWSTGTSYGNEFGGAFKKYIWLKQEKDFIS